MNTNMKAHSAPDFADAARHVAKIAKQNGIKIGSHSSGGEAWRSERVMHIRPVRSAITYAIALHEIGHILGRNAKSVLEREGNAWAWAIENALHWDTHMTDTMKGCLFTYYRWLRRRKAKGLRVAEPEKTHSFWKLLGAL